MKVLTEREKEIIHAVLCKLPSVIALEVGNLEIQTKLNTKSGL